MRFLVCSLLFLLLGGLGSVSAALGTESATGDGTFAVRGGAGTVAVTGRGAIFGLLSGRLVVNDLTPDSDTTAQVSGAARTVVVDDRITMYYGKNIHFRWVGGRYGITLKGTGIAFSAVGKGNATLTGDPDVLDDGDYSVNGAKWKQILLATTVVSFATN